MRGIWWLVVALSVGNAAAAQEIGPEDVILPAVQDEIADCMREPGRNGPSAALACFDRPGVTTDARNLSRAIVENTEFGLPGMLVGFSEAGQVDVAEIYFPNLANTNFQMALVNTTDGVQMAADLNFTRNPPSVPSTRAILSRYPQAFESGRVSVVAVRHLPGGGQRFVLVDIVTNGCRACAPVATSLRYFDFSKGRFSGFKEVGWQTWQDISMARAADRVRNGDVATIQDRLNHMGYEAGPTDGAAGPRTMAAIMDFKRDYCLPEDSRMSDSFVAYLTPEGGNFPIPACAPGTATGPAPSLPFPDGVYAADARLCPPAPLAIRAELGDRAYGLIIDVAGGNWKWGESVCTIRQASDIGSGTALDLDCLAEGTSQQSQVMLTATHSEGFSYRGRDFWQCQAPRAGLPLPAGVYAHDERLCPNSSEQAPNDVAFEAGARPLFINGPEFSWDHASCEITASRQAGPDWGLDLSCAGGNETFETTQSITLLSDTKVLFDGFERSWCGPPIEPVTLETSDNGGLPVDLEEGVYSFEVAGCPEFDDTTRTERERIAANLRVTLRDENFNQGDQTCPIASFTQTGAQTHLEMDCVYDGTPVFYRFEMEPQSRDSFKRYDDTYNLCIAPDNEGVLNDASIFPVSGARISANFGAYGPGPISDPDAYFSGQYHAATDIAAASGTPVLAPVAGDLIYFRERIASSGSSDPIQTFAILRDKQGRDWIFAHMDCTICPDGTPVGDLDTYPEERVVNDITAGTQIGVLLDYPPLGSARGDHLHLSLINRPITENGRLLPAFHRSGWALVLYTEGEAGAVERATATATGLGFIDPMDVLPEP